MIVAAERGQAVSVQTQIRYARSSVLCLIALLAVPGIVRAGTALPAGPATRLATCAEHALPERSMRQRQLVKVISEAGWSRESSRMVYWERAEATMNVLFEVLRPKTEAGFKLLIMQRATADPIIYIYSPDLGRARRVVGSGASNSVLGTDFTFEDALHLQRFLQVEDTEQVGEVNLDGHPAFVVQTVPDPETSAYSLIRSYIDKRYCLPMKTEFVGLNGAVDKTLILARDAVKAIDGRWIPLRMLMINHKQKQRTELSVSEVAINIELPAGLFTPAEIQKSH